MARMTPDELKKQLEEQDEIYGDGDDTISGSAPDPEKVASRDTAGNLEDVIGNDPDDEGEDGFNIGEEVNEDELDIQSKPVDDYAASDDDDDDDDKKSDEDEPATEGPLEHLIEQEDQ